MKTIPAVLVAVTLLIAIRSMLAQDVSTNGTPPFNTFGGGPDVINEGNLNIHYTVPVFSRAGIGMPFSFSLPVDNGVWYKYQDPYGNWHWGASFSTAQPAGVAAIGAWYYTSEGYTCYVTQGPYPTTKYTATSYTDANNTSHGLGAYLYYPSCSNPSMSDHPTAIASDGSGISITMTGTTTATVTLPNGSVITPPALDSAGDVSGNGNYSIKDTNGNQILVNADPSESQFNYILDTLGSQPITSSGGPPPTTLKYFYTAPSGAQATVAITYKTVSVESSWGCSGVAEYPQTNQHLIDKITLADSTYYEFFYDSSGRISSVDLPTGGSISYTYTGGDTGKGIFCADGSTSGFNRVSTQSGTVQYSRTVTLEEYGTIYNWNTDITDNEGNVTQLSFSLGYELQRTVCQGACGGTPLETVVTCYGQTGQVTESTCQNGGGLAGLSRKTVFRSLNGGPYSEVDTFYNTYGLVTKRDVYDWGATTYTQETQITYDTTTLGNGIMDHPSTVEVVDGAGNLKSETGYSYDDFSIPGDTETCLPTGTTCRGNLTKLTKYASSSTSFTTQMSYNLNGTVATSTDPNGTAVTTFTYGSAGCLAFPTQTKVTFGSAPLTTTAGYNCIGTVLTSSTDANQQPTSISYTDPYFWRPYSATDQVSNVTYYKYTGQTVVEGAMTFNGSQSTVDVISTLDSFGRPVYKQKRQGVGSSYFDSIQQVYDSDGRLYETSMPYQGTAGNGPGSPVYTQTSYDAMMRPTSVLDAAGGTVNMSYSQNDVYQQVAPAPIGENTKQKQLEYDGLGRLTSVCEITNNPPYSGTCGQVTGSYSGYLTKYVYDTPPNVNSLTVTQNGQPNGGTSQNRTYYYDMLGRMTYEYNPETGANQYFYDSLNNDANCGTISSPGDLVKTIDNKGLVACLSYDGLHRVTSISYSATTPATPTKVFVYDSAVVNGTTMGLTAGRLAEAYTCTTCSPTPTKLTDIGFTYSPRGELTDVYESTPHSGGYYHVNASYWAHGLLSSLTLTGTTLPTIYYGGLDGEGRVTTVTTSSQTTLANGVVYTTSGTAQPIGSLTNVTLGSGDSDAFGYDPLTGRLTSYTFKMNSAVAKTGALAWNANGSLKQLALTDNINTGNSQNCSYTHDDLARIASASCVNGSTTLWSQTFAFDPFGNIEKTAAAGTSFLPTYNLATNRYSALPSCAPSYDGDGNLTNDCTYTYTWQADGALAVATLDISFQQPVSLTYDALGRAVEQARGSTYTEIVYTPGGGKLALMNGATVKKGFIPLPGGGTAVYTTVSGSNVAYYRHSDWLGSSRLASTPTAPTTIYEDTEYAPYGESYGATGTPDFNFTGQNQDTLPGGASGLYDFLFREYSPQQSRWISPDPAGFSAVNLSAPQTWNRYAYVGNGPLTSVDPLGLRDYWAYEDEDTGGDFGCSMNGMSASCAAVSAFGGMGGGGESGFFCVGNCEAFNNAGLRISANDQIVAPDGTPLPSIWGDDHAASVSDLLTVSFSGGGGKPSCSNNRTLPLSPSSLTKLANGLYLTSLSLTSDTKLAGFTITAVLGSNLGGTGLFLPGGSRLNVMAAPGGFNVTVTGAGPLGYLMFSTPVNSGVNFVSFQSGSFTNVNGEIAGVTGSTVNSIIQGGLNRSSAARQGAGMLSGALDNCTF
jgi:RHS repeat-associated protein